MQIYYDTRGVVIPFNPKMRRRSQKPGGVGPALIFSGKRVAARRHEHGTATHRIETRQVGPKRLARKRL